MSKKVSEVGVDERELGSKRMCKMGGDERGKRSFAGVELI